MSELRSGGGTPSRAVLTALRAAAVLIVATGLNDIIAGALPTYEPLFLYLGAIAIVTLLDGLLIGAVTASIATFLYALLFGPRPPVLDKSVLLPAISGALMVVAAGIVGAAVRRMRRNRREIDPDPPEELRSDQPLLEATIIGPTEEIVTALEEMRADLRGAMTELSAARDRERALEHELRAARVAAADDAERIVAGANRAVDALAARLQEVEEHSRSREAKLEQAWSEARDALAARLQGLEADAQRLRVEVAEERERTEAARRRASALERHAAAGLDAEKRIAQIEAASERAGGELVAARLEASELMQRQSAAQFAINELTAERDAARMQLGESRQRVTALQASLDAITAERDAAQSTTASLAQRVAELESLVEATTDQQSDDVVAARLENSQLLQRVSELQALLAAAETEFDAKLQKIVSHLAEDHEQDLGTALMEKEAVRAEARSMTQRFNQLQQKVEEEQAKWHAQKQSLTEQIQQADDRAARAVEDTTRVMSDARAAWQGEMARLRARVAELEEQLAAGPSPPIDLSAPIPMPPPPEPETAPRTRILVAHPDADLREAARSSLERIGFEVSTAGDGLEGLRVAIATQPAVVIADVSMPKMDGRELCQLLKSQEKTSHIKIVLLTRNAGERVLGADEVLKKPVPFEVMRNALNGLLGR